jgi:hypothetical protein
MCRKRNVFVPFAFLFAKIKKFLTRTLDNRVPIDSNRN